MYNRLSGHFHEVLEPRLTWPKGGHQNIPSLNCLDQTLKMKLMHYPLCKYFDLKISKTYYSPKEKILSSVFYYGGFQWFLTTSRGFVDLSAWFMMNKLITTTITKIKAGDQSLLFKNSMKDSAITLSNYSLIMGGKKHNGSIHL